MTLLLRSAVTLDFYFFRMFEEVERVDGVVLESSSVSEATEGKDERDIFFIFVKRILRLSYR